MHAALALPPNAHACRPKLALRRSSLPRALASELLDVQPANTNGESPCTYGEGASESCYWTSKDPIRFGGNQINLYVYAANDPVNATDPNGMLTDECYQSIVKGCEQGCQSACSPSACIDACVGIAYVDATFNPDSYGPACAAKKKPGCYCSCIDEGVGPQLIGRVDSAAICSATCAAIPSSNPSKFPGGKLGVCK